MTLRKFAFGTAFAFSLAASAFPIVNVCKETEFRSEIGFGTGYRLDSVVFRHSKTNHDVRSYVYDERDRPISVSRDYLPGSRVNSLVFDGTSLVEHDDSSGFTSTLFFGKTFLVDSSASQNHSTGITLMQRTAWRGDTVFWTGYVNDSLPNAPFFTVVTDSGLRDYVPTDSTPYMYRSRSSSGDTCKSTTHLPPGQGVEGIPAGYWIIKDGLIQIATNSQGEEDTRYYYHPVKPLALASRKADGKTVRTGERIQVNGRMPANRHSHGNSVLISAGSTGRSGP